MVLLTFLVTLVIDQITFLTCDIMDIGGFRMTMFDMDVKELLKFRKVMKRRADKLSIATGVFINEMAFETRSEILSAFPENLTIRNPSLLKRQMRVEKAVLGESIATQQAEVGSIHMPRTTGFKEQQRGLIDSRERMPTLHSRGLNKRRKVRSSARMKPTREFKSPNRYRGVSKHNKAFNMIKQLSREKYKQPFVVHGYTGMTPGLYKFVGKKIRMLQSFKVQQKKIKTFKWLDIGVNRMRRKLNKRKLWAKALQRIRV